VHNGSLNLVFEYCATDLERVINDKAMVLDAARIKRCMRGTNPHPDPTLSRTLTLTLTRTLTLSEPEP
jgi:hypothetical protein